MSIIEIFLIGIGLAMDAFAVSICKGLSLKKIDLKKMLIVGAYFGIFQMIMPIFGYYIAKGFESFVMQIDHWIAFILLSFIGINMIREALNGKEEENNDDISFKTMIILSIATSIDALTVRNNICIFKSKYIIFSNYYWSHYFYYIFNWCNYRKQIWK